MFRTSIFLPLFLMFTLQKLPYAFKGSRAFVCTNRVIHLGGCNHTNRSDIFKNCHIRIVILDSIFLLYEKLFFTFLNYFKYFVNLVLNFTRPTYSSSYLTNDPDVVWLWHVFKLALTIVAFVAKCKPKNIGIVFMLK